MVMELKNDSAYGAQDVPFREHAGQSRSKRVIDGPVVFAMKDDRSSNVDPDTKAVTGTSTQFDLLPNKSYRFISTVAVHLRLSGAGVAAVVTDIYQPANQPIILQSGQAWRALSVIKATGASDGIAQTVEVL